MKDYIQKIIRVFTTSGHGEKVTKEVHQWLLNEEHTDEKEEALRILWEETEGKANTGIWTSLSAVYKKAGVKEQYTTSTFRKSVWRYAVAAVVVLAVSISGTFFFTKNMYSEIAMIESFTPAGDTNMIELPDGSKVQTNSETMLLYPEAFKGDTRTVYLMGEANFKVMKNPDKPFIVKSRSMAVTALGTEFNVSAYPDSDEIIATLIHGKIQVDCNNEMESYILTPAQQLIYQCNSKQSVLTQANLEDVTAWQKGMFVFRGVTMKEILSSLERRYAITFQYNASLFNADKYNFRFREKSNLDDVMMIIQEVVGGLNYKLEGNICYIKKAGIK